MNLKWQQFKYWQKGAIIFPLINIILILIGIVCVSNETSWAFYCLPWFYSAFPLVWYNFSLPLVLIISTIFWSIIGALIGVVIGKIKRVRKKR